MAGAESVQELSGNMRKYKVSNLMSFRQKNADQKNSALQSDFTKVKPVAKEQPALSYFRLFRYATCQEVLFIIVGLLFGITSGLCMPVFIVLYGEFTTLLVERTMTNSTSSSTVLLKFLGGGRHVENDTEVEKNAAILDDAEAFGIGCAGITAIQFVLDVLCVACLNYAAQKQVGRIRQIFLRSLLRQDMSWYDTSNTANVASRITGDLDKLQDGIGEKLGIFVYQIVSFVCSAVVSFLHGWKLTLVVFSCAPIIIIATAVVSKVQTSLTQQELKSYDSAGSVVEEVLSSIRTVVAFGGQDKEVTRYSEKLVLAEKMGVKRGKFSGFGSAIMWFITYCSYALAFWYGVTLILQSRATNDLEYTPAIIVIVLFGMLGGAFNLGMALPHLESFNIARGSAAAIFSIIEREPLIDSLSTGGLQPKELIGDIELRDVHFEYPARPEVKILQGLNLGINRGETVALVGSSGCGKSTVIQLIQRLYDPAHGKVLLDKVDVKDLNVNWLRNHIGVVGQEPVLFATTIKENIRYGRVDATFADIEQAAKEANAHNFILKLPQGYDTMVGERGTQLSGGQKQRIAIARALVRDPHVLLLDEATSALDLASEAIVQSALERASLGRTTIIVAHRLSTVRAADRIVCLNNGKVVEQGTHKELMDLKGHYFDLVHASASADNEEPTNKSEGDDVVEDIPIISRQISREISKTGSLGRKSMLSIYEDEEEVNETYEAPLFRILALNKPETAFIFVGAIASALVGSSFPMFAVLFGEVYGVLSLDDPLIIQNQIQLFCFLFLGIGVVAGVGSFLQSHMFGIAGVRMVSRLRIDTFRSILNQEIAWYDDEQNGVGSLCARLSGDASSVQGATGARIGSIVQAISTLVIGAIIAFVYTWKMALVALASVPVVFLSVFVEAKVMAGNGLNEKKKLEGATKIAVEAVSNIRTVAALGRELLFLNNYENALQSALKATVQKMKLRGPVFALGQTAPFFGYALALYYGGYLVATEGLHYKNIIMVAEALIFGTWMLGQSMAFAPNFGTAKLAAGRLFQLLDRKPLISSSEDSNDPEEMEESGAGIEYSNIKFFYPTRPDVKVLQGLNLLIQPGKTVALVGQSGCGKSTCIQLLQRLYDPVSGSVSLDGANVNTLTLTHLRSQLGIVSQEPTLFDRTIAENIAYGDNSRVVSIDEIINAAKKSNIHTFISSLPLGYNTRLGTKGTQLSGGQKQRIAIARALVRNPRVLLLDEATSALDNQSEKVVQEALDQAREGRTCITIAHRLATIQQADVICVLNNGVVAEKGSHSQLISKRGLYYQMHQQMSKQSD